jgi:hypothetical protein
MEMPIQFEPDPILKTFYRGLEKSHVFHVHKDELFMFVPSLLGSWTSDELSLFRKHMSADWAIRVLIPMALELDGQKRLANSVKNLEPIVDRKSAWQAAFSCRLIDNPIAKQARESAWAAVNENPVGNTTTIHAIKTAETASLVIDRAIVWDSAKTIFSRMIRASILRLETDY